MTTRGWTLLALGASMLIFGRLTGLKELVMAGAAFGLVLIAGATMIWARGVRISVSRTFTPPRTAVGGQVRVELVVEADGRLGIGPVLFADKLPPDVGPTPRLALPGGVTKRRRAVAYSVTPRMRGRHPIG
ncbi:MAG: hypothetical protein WD826_00065, partial [Actinomycetota bacterium]